MFGSLLEHDDHIERASSLASAPQILQKLWGGQEMPAKSPTRWRLWDPVRLIRSSVENSRDDNSRGIYW
jgi:hypothetical protein